MDSSRIQQIYSISTQAEFESLVIEIFQFQFKNNIVYQTYCKHIGKSPSNIHSSEEVPFLPIEFFKSHKIISSHKKAEIIFESSGTTGSITSKHYVPDLSLYQQSYLKGFNTFYGPVEDYCIIALLPSYLEREGSSLVYMVNDLKDKSKHPQSGFYLNDLNTLRQKLCQLEEAQTKTILIGVSFALLDLAEQFPVNLKHTTIMETGGMKGRRKELIRDELHRILKQAFGVSKIHSEYGMTELLSQAYSIGDGLFKTPPWMKVISRDTEDPLSIQSSGKTGGINIIDLANVHSCSFIATQDLGKVFDDGTFEVLGRFDHSDIRGCNLMAL
ncbi:acyl transferase [Flagellimonas sp. CMM7]|uniref:LuxE/PaaK family acyltransferase n=1 Tax=Flagellimonas sp. CMM7 TaxID=2654676 RepID=UPI0013D14F93|nr:acyl transferase [Flagellimonas sp. CMM7]UII78153.1 acyl transferase [Flagellimonas sp. CMM7]